MLAASYAHFDSHSQRLHIPALNIESADDLPQQWSADLIWRGGDIFDLLNSAPLSQAQVSRHGYYQQRLWLSPVQINDLPTFYQAELSLVVGHHAVQFRLEQLKPTVASDQVNVCQGLITDKAPHPMPDVARPAYRQPFIDPVFHSKIMRITDVEALTSGVDDRAVIKPLYSTVQAWNHDESLLILYRTDEGDSAGHHLYDGKTYHWLRQLPIDPVDLEQVYWSTRQRDVFYYISSASNELIAYHLANDYRQVVYDFDAVCQNHTASAGEDVMMMTDDLIGVQCQDTDWAVVYHLRDHRVVTMPNPDNRFAPQTAFSGQLLYLAGAVYDNNLNWLRSLDLAEFDSHAVFGTGFNQHDTYFSVVFDEFGRCVDVGSIVAFDMSNGDCQTLVGRVTGYPYTGSGTHLSALSYQNHGWVAASTIGYDTLDEGEKEVLDQEIYLANTADKPTVCRIAHHHAKGKESSSGYFAEPHVTLSPTGTRLLFGSDWGRRSVDTYVIELPVYQSLN